MESDRPVPPPFLHVQSLVNVHAISWVPEAALFEMIDCLLLENPITEPRSGHPRTIYRANLRGTIRRISISVHVFFQVVFCSAYKCLGSKISVDIPRLDVFVHLSSILPVCCLVHKTPG